jgi:hypothetical protein
MVDLRIHSEDAADRELEDLCATEDYLNEGPEDVEAPAPDDAASAIIRKLVELVEEAFRDGIKQGEVSTLHGYDKRIIVPDSPWGTPYATVRVMEAFRPKVEEGVE